MTAPHPHVTPGPPVSATHARTVRSTRPTRGDRAAVGRAARSALPRSAHAEIGRGARPDPIELLERQAATRLPQLVPIRYGRMLASPFTFYRGAASIMAADLGSTPHSGLMVQLCGDAHLSNFGVYASPERRLVFDVNDFDETHPGPFEWDLKRLAASAAVAGRENGFAVKERRRVVKATARGYRKAMARFAAQPNLEVWYTRTDADELIEQINRHLDTSFQAKALAALDKARSRDSVQALAKLTEVVDGQVRIRSLPPLLVPIEELAGDLDVDQVYARIRAMIRQYRATLEPDRRRLIEQFREVQVARKVVGVGSVGTRAWVILFEGLDHGDPLFLQAKEANPSVLAGFVPSRSPASQGERVVVGQRLMQATSDIFLGWAHGTGFDDVRRDFYVRQLRDGKGSAVIEGMNPDALELYGRVCGRTLARAHARSGDRVAIAAYLGDTDGFDASMADFAEAYADVNASDHAALVQAITDGRVVAESGV
jgi:uncharacterized protein (DUF2252 family)